MSLFIPLLEFNQEFADGSAGFGPCEARHHGFFQVDRKRLAANALLEGRRRSEGRFPRGKG
jgi:hypothetical protein